jgi:hypothetical protein
MIIVLALLVLADLPPPPPECRADSDCELTTFAGCCDCCKGYQLRARPKGRKEDGPCATMKCSGDCSTANCASKRADPNDFVPACISRRCQALPKNAECREWKDCRIIERASPDGGCLEKVAVPADGGVSPEPTWCPGEPPKTTSCISGRCLLTGVPPKGSKKH